MGKAIKTRTLHKRSCLTSFPFENTRVVDPDSLNPDTDLDPALSEQKFKKKNTAENLLYIFFDKNCNLLILTPP